LSVLDMGTATPSRLSSATEAECDYDQDQSILFHQWVTRSGTGLVFSLGLRKNSRMK